MGYGRTNIRCGRQLERQQDMENGFCCGRDHVHTCHLWCLTGLIIIFRFFFSRLPNPLCIYIFSFNILGLVFLQSCDSFENADFTN